MAHFAILKAGNIVEQVVVISNDIAINEQAGIDFLRNLYKDQHLPVIQTSFNNNIRKNYAGIGYQYDQIRDAFIPPKPFNSWILNEDTCRWEAPIPMPNDVSATKQYSWNEQTLSWDIVEDTI
jgi:hypothetical protein